MLYVHTSSYRKYLIQMHQHRSYFACCRMPEFGEWFCAVVSPLPALWNWLRWCIIIELTEMSGNNRLTAFGIECRLQVVRYAMRAFYFSFNSILTIKFKLVATYGASYPQKEWKVFRSQYLVNRSDFEDLEMNRNRTMCDVRCEPKCGRCCTKTKWIELLVQM